MPNPLIDNAVGMVIGICLTTVIFLVI